MICLYTILKKTECDHFGGNEALNVPDSPSVMSGQSFSAPGVIEVLGMNFGGGSFKITLKLTIIVATRLCIEERIQSKRYWTAIGL